MALEGSYRFVEVAVFEMSNDNFVFRLCLTVVVQSASGWPNGGLKQRQISRLIKVKQAMVASGGHQGPVKSQIGFAGSGQVTAGGELGKVVRGGPNFFQPGGGNFSIGSTGAQRSDFENLAKLPELVDVARSGGGYAVAGPHSLDKPFTRQAPEGLTNCGAAGFQLRCPSKFGEFFGGIKITSKQARSDGLIGGLGLFHWK